MSAVSRARIRSSIIACYMSGVPFNGSMIFCALHLVQGYLPGWAMCDEYFCSGYGRSACRGNQIAGDSVVEIIVVCKVCHQETYRWSLGGLMLNAGASLVRRKGQLGVVFTIGRQAVIKGHGNQWFWLFLALVN